VPNSLSALLPKTVTVTDIVVTTTEGDFLVMIDHVEPAQVREQLAPWLARTRRGTVSTAGESG
jgi:hypothetical protein